MKYKINLLQVPNQEVSFNAQPLSGSFKAVDIKLRQMANMCIVADVYVDGEVQVYSRRCIDRQPLLLNNSLGGNLYFMDLFGEIDPQYTLFNERFILVYDNEFGDLI